MKTNIEQRLDRPGRMAAGVRSLFTIAGLLLVLVGGLLPLHAGLSRAIVVRPTYCPDETVTVQGAGWLANETVTIDFQPNGDIFEAIADGNGNFTIDTIVISEADAGSTIYVTATNDNGDENTQSFEVNTPTTVNEISDQELCEGNAITFFAVANGTGPFTYQWFKEGFAIEGATGDSLSFSAVTPGDTGNYTVEVTGACGAVTTGAMLLVNELTTASGLNDQTVCAGTQVQFSTTASGTGPFTYAWYKDDELLEGEESDTLTISDPQPGDAAEYTVEVSGACNTVYSGATLTVNELPETTSLDNRIVCEGGTVSFTTTTTGTAPFTYTWYKNGQVIAGAVENTLVLSNVTTNDAASYTVEVSNECGLVSSSATLAVNESTLATPLASLTKYVGESATFTTTITGTGEHTIVWRKDGMEIPGETTNTLTLGSVTLGDSGAYTIEITGACNSVTNSATLTVNACTIECPADIVVTNDLNQCGAVVSYPAPVVPGACGPATCVPESGSMFPIGLTTVECSLLDGTACSFTVTVRDGQAPTVECPPDIMTVTDAASCSAVVFFKISASDNCNDLPGSLPGFPAATALSPVTIVANPPSGSEFPVGTTMVMVTGTDQSGNETTCSFKVTVTDNQPPMIECPANMTVDPAAGETTAVVTFDVMAGDNCPGVTVGCTPASGSTFQPGTTTVTCAAADVAGNTNSCSFTVTVTECVSATKLADLLKCANESAIFNTIASGSGPITYQWLFNGMAIDGATASSYEVVEVSESKAGQYCVIVSGRCGSVTNCATLTISTNTTIPSLNDVTACEGASVGIGLTPSGTGPFTFVWKKDDVVIADATTGSLVLNNVTPADSGVYSVEVSGACNTVSSSSKVTVNTNTTATALANAVVCPNGTAIFSTTAAGSGFPVEVIVEDEEEPLIGIIEIFTYVWRKDGTVIEGQTNSSLTIANVTTNEVGAYCVEVTGLCNTVTNCATLSISTATIISGLNDQSACPNDTVVFTANVSGAGPFGYVWKKDGNIIADESGSSLTLLNVQSGDAGTYTVEVTGACDMTMASAQLTVLEITATAALMDLTRRPGETAVFMAVASGTGPFTYVWKHNGMIIPGETNDTLTISPVTPADAGLYTVEVSGACLPPILLESNLAANGATGPATASANLFVDCSIMTPPLANLGVEAGSNVVFTAAASGSGPFTYVWRKNGSVIPGQTGDSLTLNNVGQSAAGEYCVEVTGACASVTNCATLAVRGDNVSVTPIVDAEVCEGGSASFTTSATGAQSFSYLWRKDGMVIPGATGNTLPITDAQASDAGTYCVAITWATGSATNCATLTVKSPLTVSIKGIDSKECSLPTVQEQMDANVCMTIVEGYPDCELRTTLSNMPDGYTVGNGTYLGWCIDYSSLIARDTIYKPTLYLTSGPLPAHLQNENWPYVNYILNHKKGTSIDIQNAIWHFIGGPVPSNDPVYYPPSQAALDMIDDALLNGEDFDHAPGQIMAVVLDMEGNVQNNIIEVRCPGGIEFCEGEIAVICATVEGTGPFTYQWFKNGQPVQGQTSDCLEIDPVTKDDEGAYTVEVTGPCNTASACAGLIVNQYLSVRILAANCVERRDEQAECPIEVNLCLGEPGAVYAHATGGGAYSYAWYKGETQIPCHTSDLRFDTVTANDAGTYSVIVRGPCGEESRCFTINVHQPVQLTPLQDMYACQDGYVSIDAIVTGDGPFTFVWKRNGVVIPGETNSSLVFVQVSSFDAGQYTVEVIGSCNYAISSMNLIIRTRTEILPLADQTVCEGEYVEFDTETSGTGPFQFVWFKDGNLLPGETSVFLAIPNAKPEDSGIYTLCVVGPCNTVTNSATLTVKALAQIVQLDNQAACLGGTATFTAQVTGAGPFSFVWKKNGQVINGQNNSTLTVAPCAAGDAGTYTVEVTGPCNWTSRSATLVINQPTAISALANQAICDGDAATFTISVTGTGPHAIVWKKNGQIIVGQNNNTLTIANATVSDAGTYTAEVQGLCNTDSSSATLTVHQKTTVAALANQASCLGETVTFTANTGGTGPFTFVWRKDGNVINGEHESMLILDGVSEASSGLYSVEVQGVCNSATASATLAINLLTEITALTNATQCVGDSVTFSTTASGSGPFTYVWRKDGNIIQGQTNSALTIASVAQNDAGLYEIEVIGACGSATSSATLAVNMPTTATDLTALTKCVGETAVFGTAASGSGPFTFVWRKDGNIIDGQTENTLILDAVAEADAGLYSVEVIGLCNTVTRSATLAVNLLTTATPLAEQIKCVGESATFSTVAGGAGPFTYLWRKDGILIDGQTGSSLSIAAVTQADAGTYSVEVTGACSTATVSAVLGVNVMITTTPLESLTKCVGESATFSTTASGTGPFTYIWRKDGNVIDGQTGSSITIAAVAEINAGTYAVEVIGACGSTMQSATLAVNVAISATPLADVTKCAGESITLSTTATGPNPISFVWRKDGNVISGQTGNSITIAALAQGDAGVYSVEVIGGCGNVTRSATVAVNTPTTATPLSDVTTCQGEIVMFSTTASGTGPFSYVWRKNGAIIPAETTSDLLFDAVQPEDAGAYSVEILGACNSVTVSALLTVTPALSITPLTSQTNCVGGTVTFSTTIEGTASHSVVWRKSGNIIAGETNSTLVLTNIPANANGTYTVEVVSECQTLTSSAELILLTCVIESITKVGDLVEVRVQSTIGARVTLECTFDFVTWERVDTKVNEDGVITFPDPNNNGTRMKFYRASIVH